MGLRKTRTVINLTTHKEYIFTDKTPLEAIKAMQDYLRLSQSCDASIRKTQTGKTLYFQFQGETYATRVEQERKKKHIDQYDLDY